MQIEFKKEQIVKNKPQSILIDYVEYKLSIPKWMIKNNSFIVDRHWLDKFTFLSSNLYKLVWRHF